MALITALGSYGVAYLQFGGKSNSKIDMEKIMSITDKKIDSKLAPLSVKIDNVNTNLNLYYSNQQQMNQNIIDILKQTNNRNTISRLEQTQQLQTVMSRR